MENFKLKDNDLVPPENYKIQNIDLAPQGRKIIESTLKRMNGVKIILSTLAPRKPLESLRITVSMDIVLETAILVETLIKLGADVRWLPRKKNGIIKNDIAAALADKGVPIFAWENQSSLDYKWCIEKVIFFKDGCFPHIYIDYGEDEPELILEQINTDSKCPTETKINELINEQKVLKHKFKQMRIILMNILGVIKTESRELKHLKVINESSNPPLDTIAVWKADPMICHCCSIVILKDDLF